MNNPTGKIGKEQSAKKAQPSYEEEASTSVYWNADKTAIALPRSILRSAMIQACAGWKCPGNKRLTLWSVVAGDVSIAEDYVTLLNKKNKPITEYAVDVRMIRNPSTKGRMMRARAAVPEWRAKFTVCWEAQHLGTDFHKTVLPEILERLGKSIGLCDFRIACKGEHGSFIVTEIE